MSANISEIYVFETGSFNMYICSKILLKTKAGYCQQPHNTIYTYISSGAPYVTSNWKVNKIATYYICAIFQLFRMENILTYRHALVIFRTEVCRNFVLKKPHWHWISESILLPLYRYMYSQKLITICPWIDFFK